MHKAHSAHVDTYIAVAALSRVVVWILIHISTEQHYQNYIYCLLFGADFPIFIHTLLLCTTNAIY